MPYRFNQPFLFALVSFISAGFFINLTGIPLFDVDEGAFSEATREMLSSGIWSATYLDGEPRYDKPILTYWIQALFVNFFGFNELGYRLHSIVAVLCWGGATYYFVKQFCHKKAAQAAILIFSSTLWVTVIGRAATADAILNCFIALTFFDIYRYQQSQHKKYIYRTWLWLALGMLTKGPVAAAIPFIASAIWFISLRQHKLWFKAIFNPLGWAILILILVPWLYMVWLEQGSGFFYGFLVDHNLNRFSATKEGHGGQLLYYVVVLPLIILPYSGLLLVLLTKVKKLWQKPFERLLMLWFITVFILVSVSQTQLPHYVLYGVTPLIILFAKYRNLFARQYWQVIFPILFFAIQIALALMAANLADNQTNLYQKQMLELAPQYINSGYLIFASLCLIVILSVFLFSRFISKKQPLSLWKKLCFAGLLQSLFCYLFLMPALAGIQQTPIKNAAEFAKTLDKQINIVRYQIHMPSFSVYRGQITERRLPQVGEYVYTKVDKLDELNQSLESNNIKAKISIEYQNGGIILARINDLTE
ncbi:glycosyltransferase family 39 protein [Catenovulum sp. 2E275]|uniref:ArnT family glycosyltransferase n=1 Tax=Catenovulum sp. 2E275 TaxID=2980497 RepID=UPI0021D12F9D|nr:glycosyltransferase family 39 protein [Catenovulum sp. 2E275]MCU4676682.1 glycosyltransferase family 39 protein [Catenovulum sp. 2E275]